MSNLSAIEWTDATWNPVTGCDRVSAGCDHCYALTLAARLKAMGNPRYQNDGKRATSGPGFAVTLHEDKLTEPLSWRKPRRIFVNSMSDLFHADVPDWFIASVFAVMAAARQHTFQILTKRPQRMQRLMSDHERLWGALPDAAASLVFAGLDPKRRVLGYPAAWPLPNVWLGTSVENQEAAYRIDWLVKTPAAVRFLSCEPLIGPLDISQWFPVRDCRPTYEYWRAFTGDPDPTPITIREGVDWVIAGGESGPGFRPVDPVWVRDLRDQCVDADVPFFMKQWGGIRPKAGGRVLDGRTWDEMPAVAS